MFAFSATPIFILSGSAMDACVARHGVGTFSLAWSNFSVAQ
jgi:hypothetical protein